MRKSGYLSAVRSRLRKNPILVWFATLAVVGTWVVEAHVHLCLDGNGTPTALHAWDSEVTCHDEDDGDDKGDHHSDQDIDPQGIGVPKPVGVETLAPICVDTVLLQVLPLVRTSADFFGATQNPLPQRPYRSIPPLRGPPV